jgi:predicted Fe-S protein YdhL (DUF1289 family)
VDELYETMFDTTVPSPCVGVCTMDPDTGFCLGCFRTLDEIAGWGMMGRERKEAILEELDGRATAAGEPPSPPGTPEA